MAPSGEKVAVPCPKLKTNPTTHGRSWPESHTAATADPLKTQVLILVVLVGFALLTNAHR